jgi:hypothetical protein
MTEPDSWAAWTFPVVFVALWVGLWIGVFHVIALWGGWKTLAESYASGSDPSDAAVAAAGERFRMRSARFRAGCSYSHCITFAATPWGLHLSLPFPFSFGHAPLRLPWSELRAREETVWLIPVVVLSTTRHPDLPIKVSRGLGRRLLAGAGAAAISEEPRTERDRGGRSTR